LKSNYISIENNKVIVYGIGRPKDLYLPGEIMDWIGKSKNINRIISLLFTHSKFKTRLSNPNAIRSLMLYLFARKYNIAPYLIARKYNIAPEQLYRIERGLKKDKLYNDVIILLDLDENFISS
jgi:hypothetical protein